MKKSLTGLAGIVLLGVCAGCGTKTKVEIPQEITIYRTENEDRTYSYFNDEKQKVNLIDVELTGKEDDFVQFDDKVYKKKKEAELKKQPKPTEPEYITRQEFQTMQESYDDNFNILDDNYKKLRREIDTIRRILEKNPAYQHQSHSSDLVPVQPRN